LDFKTILPSAGTWHVFLNFTTTVHTCTWLITQFFTFLQVLGVANVLMNYSLAYIQLYCSSKRYIILKFTNIWINFLQIIGISNKMAELHPFSTFLYSVPLLHALFKYFMYFKAYSANIYLEVVNIFLTGGKQRLRTNFELCQYF